MRQCIASVDAPGADRQAGAEAVKDTTFLIELPLPDGPDASQPD